MKINTTAKLLATPHTYTTRDFRVKARQDGINASHAWACESWGEASALKTQLIAQGIVVTIHNGSGRIIG